MRTGRAGIFDIHEHRPEFPDVRVVQGFVKGPIETDLEGIGGFFAENLIFDDYQVVRIRPAEVFAGNPFRIAYYQVGWGFRGAADAGGHFAAGNGRHQDIA
ncbi:MAG: hypothetical protein BWY71_01748 [Planctomycetes bacterium ADurb.Bin412]|nr:MAG: hypothetical protein BWY71_01748 [Planctomycetes bacterium ADurb.Bin412]